MKVFDNDNVSKAIMKLGLTKQYVKACEYIEMGNYKAVFLKPRKPKVLGVFQFRITKKYRALAFKENDSLFVYKISDHQE